MNQRRVTKQNGSGLFSCPTCSGGTRFKSFRVTEGYGIGWLQLARTEDHGQYVECQACQNTFDPEVLEGRKGSVPKHMTAARRVMVLMMCVDGDVDPREIHAIQGVYRQLGGTLSHGQIMTEVAHTRIDTRELAPYLQATTKHLNAFGREAVIRAAVAIAAADGRLAPEEEHLLHAICRDLELPVEMVELATRFASEAQAA